jgi:hypothetical protein
MTEFLVYLSLATPILLAGYIFYRIIRRLMEKYPRAEDPPSVLENLDVKVIPDDEKLAGIIFSSYIRYAQYEIWYHKEHEWNFRKIQNYLTPKTKNRYADRAILKVLTEVVATDRDKRKEQHDRLVKFPERYRNAKEYPPYVSICHKDVRLAVESVLSQFTVKNLIEMLPDLDIPPRHDA